MTPAEDRWRRARSVATRLAVADSAAAEMAFYLALALVPLIGVALAIVSRWLPVDLDASLEEVLRGVLPPAAHVAPGEVLGWARASTSRGWLTAGFIVAAWTSFRFMSLCLRSLRSLTSVSHAPRRPPWLPAAQSFFLLAVWIVALVTTALFVLLAPEIERALLRLPGTAAPSFTAFLALHSVLDTAVLFSAIFLTYRVVSGRLAGRLRVVLAALLASLGWIGASRGFALAVPVLWSATQLYGTLGSVVLFLLWAYLMSWVLLLGGFLLAPAGPVPAETGVEVRLTRDEPTADR